MTEGNDLRAQCCAAEFTNHSNLDMAANLALLSSSACPSAKPHQNATALGTAHPRGNTWSQQVCSKVTTQNPHPFQEEEVRLFVLFTKSLLLHICQTEG